MAKLPKTESNESQCPCLAQGIRGEPGKKVGGKIIMPGDCDLKPAKSRKIIKKIITQVPRLNHQ